MCALACARAYSDTGLTRYESFGARFQSFFTGKIEDLLELLLMTFYTTLYPSILETNSKLIVKPLCRPQLCSCLCEILTKMTDFRNPFTSFKPKDKPLRRLQLRPSLYKILAKMMIFRKIIYLFTKFPAYYLNTKIRQSLATHYCIRTRQGQHYRHDVACFEQRYCYNLVRGRFKSCLLYTSPSPRDRQKSRMPSSA